jgi:5-methyltetrahydropteroyltriglutamate--homocysteine methyltransferase
MDVYRAENVGSLLRSDDLLRAREQHETGGLDDAAFKRIEDRAVDEAIALQERAGVEVVTDGELRRNVFASQLVQACEGFASVEGSTVDWFTLEGERETSPVTVACVGRLERRRHLSSEEFVYLRGRASRPTKITLPSPTMYAYYWVPGVSEAGYRTAEEYLHDVTEILRDEIRELVRLGAEYVQVDAPEFGMLVDPHQQQWFASKGFDPRRLVHDGVDMINAVLADCAVRTGLHICRGNDANRYMARGGYETVAHEIFPRARVDVLLLEYDDERSGDFEPLALVPEETVVVLGLVSTKRRQLEDEEQLRRRIREGSRYVPLERLAISPQCGFASVAEGNALTIAEQEEKLRLVARVADAVWGAS